jgi:hypothetical protein
MGGSGDVGDRQEGQARQANLPEHLTGAETQRHVGIDLIDKIYGARTSVISLDNNHKSETFKLLQKHSCGQLQDIPPEKRCPKNSHR